jgi:hypothetical protein
VLRNRLLLFGSGSLFFHHKSEKIDLEENELEGYDVWAAVGEDEMNDLSVRVSDLFLLSLFLSLDRPKNCQVRRLD